MRKYIYIYKTSLLEHINYAKGILMAFIGNIIHIFIFFALWKYLYSSGQEEIINGYTLIQMLWYVTFTEFVTGFTSSSILRKGPSEEIINGNIAYTINKPYNYTLYVFSRFFAESTVRTVVNLTSSIIVALLFIGPLKSFNIIYLPLMVISIILGVIIAGLIRLIISYSSFWVENVEPFQWLYKTLLVIFGVTFPVSMFPGVIANVIKVSPIYAAISGPCSMIVNFNINEYKYLIIAQILYVAILGFLSLFIFKKGEKKLNVNGG